MARTATAEFSGNVHAPAQARAFASTALSAEVSPRQLGDVGLIVSELVTNAVRAGAAQITVRVSIDDGEVRIGVTDDVAGWPVIREAGDHDTTGRGLALVAALAQRWGVDPNDPSGKHVWATLHPARAV